MEGFAPTESGWPEVTDLSNALLIPAFSPRGFLFSGQILTPPP
jgi:hypothetical protein